MPNTPCDKTYEELRADITLWAEEKGIFEHSDPKSQMLKCVSEIGELADAILKNNRAEIADAIGDSLVTLILTARMAGFDDIICLGEAYEVISIRTGKMTNGAFVKDDSNG